MTYTYYKCENIECPDEKYYDFYQANDTCPTCGHSLTEVELDLEPEFSARYAKFQSLPPTEKKKRLKQRSNEHYQKHVKERKEYLDREAFK